MEQWFIRNKNSNLYDLTKYDLMKRTRLRILLNRDITEISDIEKYFKNPISLLNSAEKFNDFKILEERLKFAKDNNERVAIVGDYDVDGIMSTTILVKAFKLLGIDVIYKIPNRINDGYGINERIIDECKFEEVKLIITVDNGVQAFSPLKYAKDMGIDVFITDHHELKVENENEIIPESIGFIDPHSTRSEYPFKLLCGAGIAYIIGITLLKKANLLMEDIQNELVTFAGMATICDVVDLIGENRIIAYHGLLGYRNTKNIGLKKLAEVSKVDISKIDSYHIGFIIGPRFNSSGRLEVADIGIELLLTDDEKEAHELSIRLNDLNKERMDYTENGFKEALQMIDESNLPSAILVYIKNIHESVAGIIAGKLKERYYRPTIVIAKGKDFLKGSGRSVPEFDMYDSISQFSHLCEKFGGHKMACGLSIKEENLDEFKLKLIESANKFKDNFVRKVYIDALFPIEMVDIRFLDMINAFKPFGKGNEEPRFADTNLKMSGFRVYGQNRNVIKMTFISKSNKAINVTLFETEDSFMKRFKNHFNKDIYEVISDGLYMDIVYYPSLNCWNNIESVNIIVTNYRYKDKYKG